MALYKYGSYLAQSQHANFDLERSPGVVVPDSGIYRCVNCGDEIAANKGNPLPPQNHHQHRSGAPIRWKLLVCAVQV
jgi:hypothetical protein